MNKPLVDTLQGTKPVRRPIWLMRQAGRYLPEYREVRAQAGGFLDLCYTPELACEVTLQPLRRYDLDAAILFADILLIPQAMGCDLDFRQNEGPVLSKVRDQETVSGLFTGKDQLNEVLSPVYDSVSLIRSRLDDDKTMIGFCGAPWTVATYMIEGGTSAERANSRMAAFGAEAWLDDLIARLVDASIEYLSCQVEAGAEVLQIFDTWAGDLSGLLLEKYCFNPIGKIRAELKVRYPHVPVIGFARGTGTEQIAFQASTGVEAVGLEPQVGCGWARENLTDKCVVQGNLDPLALLAGGVGLKSAAFGVLKELPMDRHIFNLGHGIRKETPPEHVSELIDTIRNFDAGRA